MLDVDDILPSPLTPLVLPPPVPEPVSKMQTLALFTMAQASPQPQSVNLATNARVKPLPLSATSFSSSELHLCIGKDTISPTTPTTPLSSSEEHLLQGCSSNSTHSPWRHSRHSWCQSHQLSPHTGLTRLLRNNRVTQHPKQ